MLVLSHFNLEIKNFTSRVSIILQFILHFKNISQEKRFSNANLILKRN